MIKKTLVLFSAVVVFGAVTVAHADQHEATLRNLAENQIKTWAGDAKVIQAVKDQNAKHESLNQTDIDKLDKQWRAETKSGSKPMIDEVLANTLSQFLKSVKNNGQGIYTEIFVMDNRGLNVGQSDVTSDYWQGDEAKWKKTFKVGPEAVHIGEVKKDESTQTFQSQISIAIADPATKQVIGAVTVGIDVERVLN
jgi:hypothetical protein